MPKRTPQLNGEVTFTKREAAFVAIYATTGNATGSYLEAGYKRHARATMNASYAHRLLQKPHIRKAIEAEQRKAQRQLDLRLQRILKEIAAIAFSNVFRAIDSETGLVKPIPQIDPLTQLAIQEYSQDVVAGGKGKPDIVRTKIKMYPKWPALEKLCKLTGLDEAIDPETGKKAKALSAVRVTTPDGTVVEHVVPQSE